MESNTYKVDNFYDKSSEVGIKFDDEDLAIKWPELENDLILSEKDRGLQSYKTYLQEFGGK